ncbi:cadherin domain-containing protein [Microvirga puerhi]|uniref:Cadherin domain-containing protein n=1 Tax=Microvirga puerhi TaxID=2876078 RepID=A0ABS7VN02_9HYPH|nr:cadherin domain-containing protein [Microvirga puerhi]MBZ6076896.1 cadherin domain-containing protein [Microvirga puerhi]
MARNATVILSATTVAEMPDNNTVIGTLSVDGGANGETFTYALTDSIADRFEIRHNATSGEYELVVKTGGNLFDFERADLNHFDVAISANGDMGTVVDKGAITINVTNVNEAPTDIGILGITAPKVAENAAAGTEIGPLAALDPDANDTFTFKLKDDAGGRFQLDSTGKKLLVADGSKLDYETASSHQIKVEVKDAGGLTFERTLTIGVTDGVDTFTGSTKNDKLTGTAGSDILLGGNGNDKLYGLDGDDILNGGQGKDMLYGGKGKDTFVFDSPLKKGQFDQVMDFNSADDTLEFSLSSIKAFKNKAMKAGKLNKKFFIVGDHAKDKNDFVYYNKKNGFVYLDNDGSGHKKGIEILKLKPGLKLTADDFHFI